MAAVDQHISYLQELHAGAVVSVRTRVLEVKERSLRFEHEMVDDSTGAVAARSDAEGSAPRHRAAQVGHLQRDRGRQGAGIDRAHGPRLRPMNASRPRAPGSCRSGRQPRPRGVGATALAGQRQGRAAGARHRARRPRRVVRTGLRARHHHRDRAAPGRQRSHRVHLFPRQARAVRARDQRLVRRDHRRDRRGPAQAPRGARAARVLRACPPASLPRPRHRHVRAGAVRGS